MSTWKRKSIFSGVSSLKTTSKARISIEIETQLKQINKAINNHESPVKEKHVKSIIEKTFQDKGGQSFWMAGLKLPLQDSRIVAWKFCHVLHKVLREGHPEVVAHSREHSKSLEDLGKLWGQLEEGCGRLIQHYTQFLITKLDFHRRNPRFPGNLVVTEQELESIGENDANNYYQICIEMFDYLDAILTLQSAVFGSLDVSRCNAMTPAGQFRLAPLIPCIQDSSSLYGYCVKILFRLHSNLPPEMLTGHRERFLKQFKVLKEFYETSSYVQYLKDLIHIPLLPDNPPNFLTETQLKTYVIPVSIPVREDEEESDEWSDEWSDTTSVHDDISDLGRGNGPVSSPEQMGQRDHLVQQLQNEISRLREKIQHLELGLQKRSQEHRDKIAALEIDLATKDSELLQERHLKEVLQKQTQEASKHHEYEKRAKTMEEKFEKLKDVYTKLREEFSELLRNKAEVDKQLELNKQSRQNAVGVQEELRDVYMMLKEQIQKSAEKDYLIEQLQNKITGPREEVQHLRMMLQKRTKELSDKISGLEMNLAIKDRELLHEMRLKEGLLEEISEYREHEGLAKALEEKFQKLKEVYTMFRKEHIELIRSKAEIEKQLVMVKQSRDNTLRVNQQLSARFNELLREKSKLHEILVRRD